jgi:hypothetical protein
MLARLIVFGNIGKRSMPFSEVIRDTIVVNQGRDQKVTSERGHMLSCDISNDQWRFTKGCFRPGQVPIGRIISAFSTDLSSAQSWENSSRNRVSAFQINWRKVDEVQCRCPSNTTQCRFCFQESTTHVIAHETNFVRAWVFWALLRVRLFRPLVVIWSLGFSRPILRL